MVIMRATNAGPAILQDTQRNAWIEVIKTPDNSGSSIYQMMVCLNCVGGANTITANGNISFYTWSYGEYANDVPGVNILNTFRIAKIASGTGTNFAAPVINFTPSTNNIIIGGVGNGTANSLTISSTGSFVQDALANGNVGLFRILNDSNTTETFSGTYSSAVSWVAMAAAFTRSPSTASLSVSNGVWVNKGAIISPIAADSPGQPNVFYESGSKIFSGTVFKMIFSTTAGLCYAESIDGITGWTRYGSNPIIAGAKPYPKVFKNGSTYYLYTGVQSGPIKVYTATDLVGPWTLQNATALTITQFWEGATFFGQLCVAGQDGGGTWHGYYTSINLANYNTNYIMGHATSTDLINWTKDSANPVLIEEFPSNMDFHLIGGSYYGWSQIVQPGLPARGNGSLPSDITRYIGSGPAGPFNLLSVSTFYRSTSGEGVGEQAGQVADPSLIEVNGSVYMYMTITFDGSSGANFSISCAVASIPFSQLVTTTEGIQNVPIPSNISLVVQLTLLASDTFSGGNANPIGGNWSTLASSAAFGAMQLASNKMEPASADGTIQGASYWNALAWPANQWSQTPLGASVGATARNGVILRGNTSGVATCYVISVVGALGGTCSVRFDKYLAGVLTTLATYASYGTVFVGDVLTGVVEGTTLSAYINGNLVTTVVDTDIATGAAGVCLFAPVAVTNAQITGWAGGAVSTVLISGNAGIAGATVSYTGPTSGSVTADSSGNYSISGAQDGTYTVTPSKTGYSFSPSNQTVPISGLNVGGINFTATQVAVATPTFSPVAGRYNSTQTVTVLDTDSGLAGFAMYYTIDGSVPTTGSTPYSGPITVHNSETIKVLAVATGYANSAIASATYVIAGGGDFGFKFTYGF